MDAQSLKIASKTPISDIKLAFRPVDMNVGSY